MGLIDLVVNVLIVFLGAGNIVQSWFGSFCTSIFERYYWVQLRKKP